MTSDPEQIRRRVEAARAYAGISSQKKLALAIGMSRDTLLNRMDGTYPWRRGDLLAIAEACGVPIWFLEHGFEPPAATGAEEDAPTTGDAVALAETLRDPATAEPRSRESSS